MITMKVTNTKTQESVEVEAETITETVEKLKDGILKMNWDTENLRFESDY